MQSLSKVDLFEDFLQDLPQSKRKIKAKRLHMISSSKADAKMQRYKILKERFAKEYIKEKNRIDSRTHS